MEKLNIEPEPFELSEKSHEGLSLFDEQFSKREHFELAGGIAEVVDLKPEKLKDDVPVFFAPAWGLGVDVYKPAMETLVGQERRVVSLSHPRRGGNLENVAPEEIVKKYPTEELRKALNIISTMEQKGVDKADFIAHSEGAINTVIAAVLHPEKFRNIVFYGPAGLIGKDTFSRLAKGFIDQNKRADSLYDMPISETEKKVGEASLKSVIEYLRANPLRAAKEVYEISQSQTHEMIRYLHDKGVGIVVMSGVDDPVFPPDKMKKIATFDKIDGFMTMRGGHGGIGEQAEHMIWAEKLLTALESQRQKKSEGKETDLTEEFV